MPDHEQSSRGVTDASDAGEADEESGAGSTVRAAGGVVWRAGKSGKKQVVLVHRPAYGDWSFPKGKLKVAESERDAAVRELEEETGLEGRLGADLGHTFYLDKAGRPKTVRYFRMTAKDEDSLAPANEVDDARWVPVPEAASLLTYWHDREVLQRFSSTEITDGATVYMVRHAKAGSSEEWTEPDHLRPLTDSGFAQADGIARWLADREIGRIVSSPYVRCVQTLEPLARELGIGIQMDDSLAEGAAVHEAETLLRPGALEGSVALCTHGDVMMDLVGYLLDDGVRLRGEQISYKKGCTWVLKVRDGTVISAKYEPPPAS